MPVSLSPRFHDATGHGDNLLKQLNGSNVKQHILNKIFVYTLLFFPPAFIFPGHKTAVLQKNNNFLSSCQLWVIFSSPKPLTPAHSFLINKCCLHGWQQRVCFYVPPVPQFVCFIFSSKFFYYLSPFVRKFQWVVKKTKSTYLSIDKYFTVSILFT